MNPQSCDPFRAALLEGADRASRLIRARDLEPWELSIGRVAVCPLASYPEGGVGSEAETVAAVVVGLRGPRCGSTLVALEPKAALRLIQRPSPSGAWEPGDAQAAVDAYVVAAGAVATILCAAVVPGAEYGPASLVEESLPGAMVSTHAPGDTLVLSAEIEFHSGDERLRGHACVMLDAKLLAAPAQAAAPA